MFQKQKVESSVEVFFPQTNWQRDLLTKKHSW